MWRVRGSSSSSSSSTSTSVTDITTHVGTATIGTCGGGGRGQWPIQRSDTTTRYTTLTTMSR